MANSSFFKNTGTSTQLQGSANASAAAALASEQAALASENASQTSETNAAASAAAALVSKNAAANSAASVSADAAAAATSATASQTAATSSSANVALTNADATQTAADRVQTGLDRIDTAADAVQTAADRVQTGLDVTSTGASAAAALSSRNAAATSETNASASATAAAADAVSTAADVISTAADAASTAADALATAADRVQTGLDVTASASSASAANTSASAASASQVSAASSAASAAAVFNDFEDRYYGPHASDSAAQTHVTGQGLTVDQGDLYFNSTANEMRVYDGGSWVAASSAGGASLINYNYTATASQTAFSGSDDNSNTLSYTVDNLIVTRNGVVLEDGTDYTATDGSTITLTVAAAAGDEINVVAFKSFTTADMVSATNGGTFQSNVTVNGTMTATSFSGDGSSLTGIPTPTLTSLGIANHDDITVDGSGNVTVTGTVDGRDVATDGTKLDGIEAGADVTDDTNVRAAGAVMTTGVSTLADSAYFKGAPTHGFRFNSNTDAYNNFIIRENGDTYTRGNAGIGTASPTGGKLEVTHSSSTVPAGFFRNTSGSGNSPSLTVQGGANNAAPNFSVLDYDGNTDFVVQGTGNVGIGVTPSELLHIKNASGDAAVRIDGNTRKFKIEQNSYGLRFVDVDAGSVERLRIDAAGIVTMPYQPSFAASRSSSDVTNAVYVYPNVYHNTGGHYNNSNGRFTAPVTGSYFISANHMSGSSTYNNYEYHIRVNGSVHQVVYSSNGGNVHHRWNWHGVIYLQAGDYVDVFIPAGFVIYGQSNLYQHFSGYLIG